MNNLTIRGVKPEDRAIWGEMWRDYLAFYETELPEAQYEHAFGQLLGDEPGSFRGLIAEGPEGPLGGAEGPLGFVHFVFHPHMWRAEGCCYLQDLFTTPAARGQGVGRALIEAVYGAADAEGVGAVYWLTQEFNYTGRMLYDRVGVKTPFIRYNRPT